VATVAALAALAAIPALAAAGDSRAGSSNNRLFYGTAAEQDITNFTVDPGEPATTGKPQQCLKNGSPVSTTMFRTAWFSLTGTGGTVTVSAGSATQFPLDTVLAVYEVGGTIPLACSDDVSASDHTSRISGLPTSVGKPYEVQVGTSESACELFSCIAGVLAINDQSPPGDQRAGAIPLVSPESADNTYATEEPGEVGTCVTEGIGHGYGKTIWFDYRPTEYGTATIRTTQAAGPIDTIAAIYAGDSPTPLACIDDEVKGKVLTSVLTVPTARGRTTSCRWAVTSARTGPSA
jgi:hypothetical protein